MSWPKLISFLLLLLLFGCSDGPLLEPLRSGDPAPPFTLTLTEGATRTLADYRGKGLVVTFMASWCPCSNDSLPMFQAAHAQFQDKVEFLMIGIQESESKFTQFVQKNHIPYATGFDNHKIAREYGVNSPPTTIFIDRDGRVKRFFYGNIKKMAAEFPGWVAEVSG